MRGELEPRSPGAQGPPGSQILYLGGQSGNQALQVGLHTQNQAEMTRPPPQAACRALQPPQLRGSGSRTLPAPSYGLQAAHLRGMGSRCRTRCPGWMSPPLVPPPDPSLRRIPQSFAAHLLLLSKQAGVRKDVRIPGGRVPPAVCSWDSAASGTVCREEETGRRSFGTSASPFTLTLSLPPYGLSTSLHLPAS